MITDKITNCRMYETTNPHFAKVFDYIENTDLLSLQVGRYDIDGDNAYLMIQEYETKSAADGKIESHEEYIDIQYVLSGVELMGYAPKQQLEMIEDQRPAKDNKIYRDPKGELSFVKYEGGMFAIFFPDDAHMPLISAGEKSRNRKAVVKVRV